MPADQERELTPDERAAEYRALVSAAEAEKEAERTRLWRADVIQRAYERAIGNTDRGEDNGDL